MTCDDNSGSSLAELFSPWPVITDEARLPPEPPPIPAEEAAAVSGAGLRRRVEFATGRACARRVLERMGIRDFILRNDPQRAPCWPRDVVGSLTHTGEVPGGYCAVAVARAGDLLSLGVDAEKATPLPPRLWAFVLTAEERTWLAALAPARQGVLAKVIFSAKESYYKAQFPVTRRWVGFQEVTISLDVERGTFEARLHLAQPSEGAIPNLPANLQRCAGRFGVDQHLVRTAITVHHENTRGRSHP